MPPELKKFTCVEFPDIPIWKVGDDTILIGATMAMSMLYPKCKKQNVSSRFGKYIKDHPCMTPTESVMQAIQNGPLNDYCYKLGNQKGRAPNMLTLKGAQVFRDHPTASMDTEQHKKFKELVDMWEKGHISLVGKIPKKKSRCATELEIDMLNTNPSAPKRLQTAAINGVQIPPEHFVTGEFVENPDMSLPLAHATPVDTNNGASVIQVFAGTVQKVLEYNEKVRLDMVEERQKIHEYNEKVRLDMKEERIRKDKLIEDMARKLLERS